MAIDHTLIRMQEASLLIGGLGRKLEEAAKEADTVEARDFFTEQAAIANRLKETCRTPGLDEEKVDKLAFRRLKDMEDACGLHYDIKGTDEFIGTIQEINHSCFRHAAGYEPVDDIVLPITPPPPGKSEPLHAIAEAPAKIPAPSTTSQLSYQLEQFASRLDEAGEKTYTDKYLAAKCREKAEQVREQRDRLDSGQSLETAAPWIRRTLDSVHMALGDKKELDPSLRKMIGTVDHLRTIDQTGTVAQALEAELKLRGSRDHGQLKVTGGMQKMGNTLTKLADSFATAAERNQGDWQFYTNRASRVQRLADLCLHHSTDCEAQSEAEVRKGLRTMAIEFNELKRDRIITGNDFDKLNTVVQRIATQAGAIQPPTASA